MKQNLQLKVFFDEAKLLIMSNIKPLRTQDNASLIQSYGRICARKYRAKRDVPKFDNAAVDGVAFCYQDYQDYHARLRLNRKDIRAAKKEKQTIKKAHASKIMTGAPVPLLYDTIAMQEDVKIADDYVILPATIKSGANLRKAGEDRKKNDIIITKGEVITPELIAAMASCGFDRLQVIKKPTIAIISTGDEIILPGKPYVDGMLYDANAPMLCSMVEKSGCKACLLPNVVDDPEMIESSLFNATKKADMILISGGASQGSADYINRILQKNAKLLFTQVAIKPGRPLTFAIYNKIPIFCLPGNPVAVFVCFLMFVAKAIAKLANAIQQPLTPMLMPLKCDNIISKKPHRREFWRALMINENNRLWLKKFPQDGSGLIRSLTESNGIIEVPEDVTVIKNGDKMNFYPYEMFYRR